MSTIKSERYNLLPTDNFQPVIVMRSYSFIPAFLVSSSEGRARKSYKDCVKVQKNIVFINKAYFSELSFKKQMSHNP